MMKFIHILLVNKLSLILIWLLILVSPALILSQTPSSTSVKQIEKLDFLIGEWKGKGWIYRLDGSRSAEISQSTKVKWGKDNSTLSISDKKKYPDLRIATGAPFPMGIQSYPINSSGEASIYYDEATKLYYWRWDTSAGRKTPFPAQLLEPKTLQMKFEYPGGVLVRTVKVTEDGEWHERFDIWLGDKDGWFKSQEIILKKAK
jgi:hypothetical protein